MVDDSWKYDVAVDIPDIVDESWKYAETLDMQFIVAKMPVDGFAETVDVLFIVDDNWKYDVIVDVLFIVEVISGVEETVEDPLIIVERAPLAFNVLIMVDVPEIVEISSK